MTVAVVAGMRATMFRRALREHPGPLVAALTGLLAAGWLIRYAARPGGDGDTLTILVGTWVLGWIVLPLLLGGVRGRVRPAHLRLEAVRPPVMAVALLAASAIGIGPGVSLIAVAALPVHAARGGAGPALTAAAGALLLWLLGLIGSAVALEAAGRAGGPGGAVLTGVLTGTVMGVLGSVWAVAPWAGVLLVIGPPAGARTVLRWAQAPGLLPVLVLAAFTAYVWLVRRVVTGGVRSAPGRGATDPGRFPRSATGAVTAREWHTWRRHPLRLQYLSFAVVYGALLAWLPLLAHVDLLVPWAGPLAVLWAAAMSAGLVGLDGTALWIPLTTPGGERAEVLGRSVAWLALAVPVAAVLTTAALLIAPGVDPVPALAVLPAVLAAGAGAPVWVSLLRVRPIDDPRRPTAADNPTDIVSVLLTMAVLVAAAAPGFALVVWGPSWARWPAVLVGAVCGIAAGWGTVRLAADRLSHDGPAVLTAAGQRTTEPGVVIPAHIDAAWVRANQPTVWALALLCAGWVPVMPQGLMVLVFHIHGGWIVASHLTGAARTGAALGMIALGGAMLLTGLILWGRTGRARAAG